MKQKNQAYKNQFLVEHIMHQLNQLAKVVDQLAVAFAAKGKD